MTGPYMTATVSNIAVYGDEDFNAAERTADAQLRFEWAKGGYEPQDVVFTADGATIRVPEVEEVQKFVDAAAKGDDDTAGGMATDEVMRDLDTVIGDGMGNKSVTYRDLALQDGTDVDTCELIGVVDEEYGDYTMSNGVGLMEGIGGFGADSIKAGDVICGLKGPGETIDPNDDGSWYAAHLLLTGTEAGKVRGVVVSSYTGWLLMDRRGLGSLMSPAGTPGSLISPLTKTSHCGDSAKAGPCAKLTWCRQQM